MKGDRKHLFFSHKVMKKAFPPDNTLFHRTAPTLLVDNILIDTGGRRAGLLRPRTCPEERGGGAYSYYPEERGGGGVRSDNKGRKTNAEGENTVKIPALPLLLNDSHGKSCFLRDFSDWAKQAASS